MQCHTIHPGIAGATVYPPASLKLVCSVFCADCTPLDARGLLEIMFIGRERRYKLSRLFLVLAVINVRTVRADIEFDLFWKPQARHGRLLSVRHNGYVDQREVTLMLRGC
jgi:hypothetical protein